jgi:cobalt-zinc-cadmium resistance protein CzcA
MRGTSIILLLFFCQQGIAQSIELSEAEQLCLKNNGNARAALLRTQAAEKMSKGWLNLPATNLAAEVGQFNSLNIDTRFAISQSIDFPTVYHAEKKLLEAEHTLQQANEGVVKSGIIKDLRKAFYKQRVLKEKLQAICFTDSLLKETGRRISLKRDRGEIDQADLLQNETRSLQQQSRTLSAEAELRETELMFRLLIGENGDRTASAGPLLMEIPGEEGLNSPLKKLAAAETESRQRAWISAKQKLLPGFNFSYNNLSLSGWQRPGEQEQFFGSGYRFHSGMAGLNIPVFFGGLKSKAAAAKLSWMEAGLIQEQIEKEQQTEMKRLQLNLASVRSILNTYETRILPDAVKLSKLINRRFQLGEISYTEWGIVIRQEAEFRLEYLQQVQIYNDYVAELLFLQGK